MGASLVGSVCPDWARLQSLRARGSWCGALAVVHDLFHFTPPPVRRPAGTVFLVKHNITGQEYALKSIEKRRINPELYEDMRTEISILQMVRATPPLGRQRARHPHEGPCCPICEVWHANKGS
jgi:hypothetical protein